MCVGCRIVQKPMTLNVQNAYIVTVTKNNLLRSQRSAHIGYKYLSFCPKASTLRSGICRRNSVCLFVHLTQPVEIFGNVSTPFSILAIRWPLIVPGEPLRWGLNARGLAKYSDARHVEEYISETVQDAAPGTISD